MLLTYLMLPSPPWLVEEREGAHRLARQQSKKSRTRLEKPPEGPSAEQMFLRDQEVLLKPNQATLEVRVFLFPH